MGSEKKKCEWKERIISTSYYEVSSEPVILLSSDLLSSTTGWLSGVKIDWSPWFKGEQLCDITKRQAMVGLAGVSFRGGEWNMRATWLLAFGLGSVFSLLIQAITAGGRCWCALFDIVMACKRPSTFELMIVLLSESVLKVRCCITDK